MGESLDRAVKREQALEATRRAVEDWTRRYAGPVAELPFETTVEQVPAGDRALVAEFLAKARRSQFEKGTVLAHPDGSDRMLTGIHGLGFRRRTAPVARRLHGGAGPVHRGPLHLGPPRVGSSPTARATWAATRAAAS
jgi:hypothetical protein